MSILWPTRAPSPRFPVMSEIAERVAAEHGLTVADLKGPCRKRRQAFARFQAMWECRQHSHLSLNQIGHFFGDRDHSTVLHAVKRHIFLQSPGEFDTQRSLRSRGVEYDSPHG